MNVPSAARGLTPLLCPASLREHAALPIRLFARRAFGLGVGLLSGGYGREELERAGAYRVYQDPAELLKHLDEVGVRLST